MESNARWDGKCGEFPTCGPGGEKAQAVVQSVRDNPHLTDEQRAAVEESVGRQLEPKPVPSMSERKSRGEELPAWWGEPPAENTRRQLILNTIHHTIHDGGNSVTPCTFCRKLADAVESALSKRMGEAPTPVSREPGYVVPESSA